MSDETEPAGALGVLASCIVGGQGKAGIEKCRRLVGMGMPFVWDSGAWSVFTGAATLTVEEHSTWVRERLREGLPGVRFIGLDVIGDAGATLDNYRQQRAAGLEVEPTIHFGTPLEQIDRLLEAGDTGWLNVGGIVGEIGKPSRHRNVAAFIAAVRRRIPPEVKIHALGCTPASIARLVHFDACDSTYWLSLGRFRTMPLFDKRRADWRKYSVVTTSTDPRRETTWTAAYRDGTWLRSEYGVTPEDVVAPNDERLLAAIVDSQRMFADWVSALHGKPMTLYLAGTTQYGPGYNELIRRGAGDDDDV